MISFHEISSCFLFGSELLTLHYLHELHIVVKIISMIELKSTLVVELCISDLNFYKQIRQKCEEMFIL